MKTLLRELGISLRGTGYSRHHVQVVSRAEYERGYLCRGSNFFWAQHVKLTDLDQDRVVVLNMAGRNLRYRRLAGA